MVTSSPPTRCDVSWFHPSHHVYHNMTNLSYTHMVIFFLALLFSLLFYGWSRKGGTELRQGPSYMPCPQIKQVIWLQSLCWVYWQKWWILFNLVIWCAFDHVPNQLAWLFSFNWGKNWLARKVIWVMFFKSLFRLSVSLSERNYWRWSIWFWYEKGFHVNEW